MSSKALPIKAIFGLILPYYIVDIILLKWLTPIFWAVLTRTKLGFDIVSLGGILFLLHGILAASLVIVVPFLLRTARWPIKTLLIYAITAILFYGFIVYGDIKGGGVLEPDYIGYFILYVAMLLLSVLVAMFVARRLSSVSPA